MSDTPTHDSSTSRAPLEQILSTLKQRAFLILACVVLTGLVATIASAVQTKQYTSVASLLFKDSNAANSVFGAETVPSYGQDAIREAATNIELVSLRVVSARAAEALGDGTTASEVDDAVAVEPQGQSDLVLVKATDTDAKQAQRIANTFATEFIRFRATADRSRLIQAKGLADREFRSLSPEAQAGPRGDQLSRGAERLGILASLQTGNAELAQPAELPTSASSPKPLRNGLIGAFLGLLLGIALAFMAERLNRQLRNPDETAEAFGLPILGTVPESKAIKELTKDHDAVHLPFADEESFRMVRASLRYFSVDRDIKTLLITSSAAQAGKSTLAWNLARVAAKTSKVVLLETDLRNPSIAAAESQLNGPGLAEILTHQIELGDAIQEVQLDGAPVPTNGSPPTTLSVITAGSIPPNPADLIESQGMTDVIARLKDRFDFVVIDTAPIGVVSDSFPLMSQVDGVVVVARMQKTSRDAAEDLRDQLARLDAPVLGVVANGVKANRSGQYGYGYGYFEENPAAGSPSQPVKSTGTR